MQHTPILNPVQRGMLILLPEFQEYECSVLFTDYQVYGTVSTTYVHVSFFEVL